MRRFLAWTAGSVLVLGVLALIGVGWYYSGEILTVEQPDEAQRDTEVLRVTKRTVVLENTADARQVGTFGLDAPEAYAQVGSITEITTSSVTRSLELIDGTLQQGDVVDVDGYAFPQDPEAAFDFPVREIDIAAPLGDMPAWFAPGDDEDRWAVLVHGRGARRNECFRMVEILRRDHDFSSLCVSYRNDPEAPADEDGIYRQGAREWEDIEPAVRYALDQGAKDVLLVGFSMGGQITANLLRHSDLAKEVDAVIWDSPLLDWGPVIAAAAEERGVPGWLVPIGMQASEWRAGVDYAALNQVRHAEEFTHPILLFHGASDGTVPVRTSHRFAKARPDIVSFNRFDEAEHVSSWNSHRERYEQAVNSFVAEQFAGAR